jgi:capsular exopolysaccharide synthesis family protein
MLRFGAQQAATKPEPVSEGIIARRTRLRLEQRGELAAAAAVADVEMTSHRDSGLLLVEATGPSPRAAVLVANTIAEEYVAFRRDSDRANIRRARRALRRELDDVRSARKRLSKVTAAATVGELTRRMRSLERRSENLRLVESLQTGNAVVVDRATPRSSMALPRHMQNTAVGVFAGLLLGLAIAFLLERVDRRLRDSKELEEAFGLPILLRLPESNALDKRSGMADELPPLEAKAFEALRANLRYVPPDRKIDSVLITSPSVDDGKSTVAFHLAAAAASTGLGVLLVEADVRRPTLANALGLAPNEGLTSLLSGVENLGDVCHEILLSHTNGNGSAPTIDVVPAGEISADASELIRSEQMQDLIREFRRKYSLVVIDTPAVDPVPDAVALMSEVSAVIVVGRIGAVTTEEASRLREKLEQIEAPMVGVVANCTRRHDRGSDPADQRLYIWS